MCNLTTYLNCVAELVGVGGEEGNVEHALRDRLLGRIPVGVQLTLTKHHSTYFSLNGHPRKRVPTNQGFTID